MLRYLQSIPVNTQRITSKYYVRFLAYKIIAV